jgi:hypothetical protein
MNLLKCKKKKIINVIFLLFKCWNFGQNNIKWNFGQLISQISHLGIRPNSNPFRILVNLLYLKKKNFSCSEFWSTHTCESHKPLKFK